ncbi:MAG: ribosomal protein S18-alanine N-acetyltransferase [Clostridium sp.]
MDLIVKLMEPCHIDEVVKISRESFSISWSEDSFRKELSNPLAKYVVGLIDNQVVGFAGVWMIIDEGHITNIAVSPNFRGQKIATKLLAGLIEQAENWGCYAITLEVRKSNIIAQKLYESAGFVNEGIRKGYYEDNKEDAIIMWKRN